MFTFMNVLYVYTTWSLESAKWETLASRIFCEVPRCILSRAERVGSTVTPLEIKTKHKPWGYAEGFILIINTWSSKYRPNNDILMTGDFLKMGLTNSDKLNMYNIVCIHM